MEPSVKEAPIAIKIDTGDNQAELEASIPVCFKPLDCGHNCNGVADEKNCLPCLESGCASKHYKGDVDADQLCGICYTSELGAEACSKLGCGHVFHTGCVVQLLKHRWTTLKINFAFMSCPQCNTEIDIKGVSRPIAAELGPLRGLKQKVEKEALINAEKQGILKDERLSNKDDVYYNQPQEFANARCSFYECFECKKPYFGGLVDCEILMAAQEQEEQKKENLMCQDCLLKEIGAGQTTCDKHGTEQIDWKCQFCCSTALFCCFGTHYFCEPCHDEYNRTMRPPLKDCGGINCPLGIAHPAPNADPRKGGVFPLGCGICRSEKMEKLSKIKN